MSATGLWALQHHENRGVVDNGLGVIVSFITSSPVVAMAIEGENAIEVVRKLMGVTNPQQAAAGTIRGDYGLDLTKNLVHGSDSLASAQRELPLFFSPEEIRSYKLDLESWM